MTISCKELCSTLLLIITNMCVFSLGIKPASAAFCVVKASSRPQWQIRMESCTAKVHIHTHKHTHIVKMVLVYLHCTLKPEHLIFNQNYRKKPKQHTVHTGHIWKLPLNVDYWLSQFSFFSAVCYAKNFGPKGFGLGNAAMLEERQ